MVKRTTIRRIGNSAGLTLSRAMLDRLKLREGDTVYLVETERGVLVTPYDPQFEKIMDAYEVGSKRFRNAMAELAKK